VHFLLCLGARDTLFGCFCIDWPCLGVLNYFGGCLCNLVALLGLF
jgi:hypothetical protein